MSEPLKNPGDVTFSSDDSVVVVFEGPGDTTRRPRRRNNPRDWPCPERTQEPPTPGDQSPPPSDATGK
jgi:hypothetical protein